MQEMTSAKVQQRDAALESANRIRLERARLRREAKAGEADVSELIRNPPASLATAAVGEVVTWARGIGDWRARRLLYGLVRDSRTALTKLSPQTRRQLAERIEEDANHAFR